MKSKAESDKSNTSIEYSPEVCEELCNYIANGMSLRTATQQPGMPSSVSVFSWIRTHEDFAKQYAHACEERTESYAEEIVTIAEDVEKDNAAVQKAKLQIDTRKWIMSKMKPKKYGDKLDLTSDGKVLPTPIYGGLSGATTPGQGIPVSGHNSNEEDIPA